MDHLCYLNTREEIGKLRKGVSVKLVKGTRRKKPPFKHVFSGDRIFFVDANKEIILCGEATNVLNVMKSDTAVKNELLQKYRDELDISRAEMKKMIKKCYLVLITLENIRQVENVGFHEIGQIKRMKWILAGSINE